MKTFGKTSFGFAAVTSGVRAITYEPELIVTTTSGGFRITPPVSKALLLKSGDNVMFINNIDGVTEAINERAAELLDFCAKIGLDIDSPEAAAAIHEEFDMWGIAKGIQEFDSKGVAKTIRERLTEDDRKRFVDNNYEAMVESVLNGDSEELKAAISREGITREEVIAVLAPSVQGAIVNKFKGSKAANPSGMSGIGTSLTFSDSNVWAQLKADMGDDAKKLNKVYSIDIENLIDVPVNDGSKDVVVKVAVLGKSRIEEAQARNKKA